MAPAAKRDQRIVLCPKCDGELAVGVRAQTVVCRHCNRTIDVQDHTINQYFARKTFETSGDIIVERKGTIRADVKARRVVVRGKLYGRVIARDRVELGVGATLQGDIDAPLFRMEEGAIYVGRCDVHPRLPESARDPASRPRSSNGQDPTGSG